MKILRAKHPTPGTHLMNLSAMIPMVNNLDDYYAVKILEDIEERGLMNPVVIVAMTGEQWMLDKETNNPDILDPPTDDETIYLRLQCGNTRYVAARALGYDAIDCITFTSIQDAEQWCAANRKKHCGRQ